MTGLALRLRPVTGPLSVLAGWLATRWRRWRATAPDASAAGCAVGEHARELDREVHAQLRRAVDLSETQALDGLSRASELRTLSGRLLAYLDQAHQQSEAMQEGIEGNAEIIQQLGEFVRKLPRQIAEERAQVGRLVSDIRGLQDLAETIRGMARQTEILAINAAIEAARAGVAGRGFAVLAGEVRRLATESTSTARRIESEIDTLVHTVETGYSAEFQARTQHNEAESERLSGLTQQLDESYIDMRQFYQLLMTAVTRHNSELDAGIAGLLDTGQYQDVIKQIIDRVEPAMDARQALSDELATRLRAGRHDQSDLDARARQLLADYLASEALHRDPDAARGEQPGEPMARIELF